MYEILLCLKNVGVCSIICADMVKIVCKNG